MKSGLESTPMVQTLFKMETFHSESGEIPKMSTQITQGTEVPHTVSEIGASSYEPLSSVWQGSDGDLLEAMLKFYATITPDPILDATYNAGRFWKGSARRIISM